MLWLIGLLGGTVVPNTWHMIPNTNTKKQYLQMICLEHARAQANSPSALAFLYADEQVNDRALCCLYVTQLFSSLVIGSV